MPLTMVKHVILVGLLSLSVSGCMQKELAVPLKPQGAALSGAVEMGEDYQWQVFYSLENNVVVSSNRYTAWDLAFEASASGRHIRLNGAKFRIAVYPVNKPFHEIGIRDTVGIISLIDASSGNMDSTAFGDWEGKTYIVHRGTNEQGDILGFAKIQILSVDATKYTLRFALFDEATEHTIELLKNDQYNFVCLSLDNGGTVKLIEPPKEDWDLVFTKYTHFYPDLNMRYSVVGCLINPFHIAAALDSSSATFEAIDLIGASKMTLNSSLDAIGFEWKSYDITKGKFTIDPQKKYIIRSSTDGVFYKLRFIDFYKSGIKGSPHFEFQRL